MLNKLYNLYKPKNYRFEVVLEKNHDLISKSA